MKLTRLKTGVAIGIAAVALFLATASNPISGAFLFYLPLGWWHFLARNVPEMQANWDLVATALACSALILVLGQWLFRVLSKLNGNSPGAAHPAPSWPWRRTVTLYAASWVLFAIAIGSAGVFKHATWLLDSPAPWYQRRKPLGRHGELILISKLISISLANTNSLSAARAELTGYKTTDNHPVWEDFSVVFFGPRMDEVAAHLVVPRKQAKNFSLGTTPDAQELRPVSELARTLAELNARYPWSQGL